MKTTIDIPEEVLNDTLKYTGAKTKRDAVVSAMMEFNRRERAEAFIKRIKEGPKLDFPSNDDLESSELARGNRGFDAYHSESALPTK